MSLTAIDGKVAGGRMARAAGRGRGFRDALAEKAAELGFAALGVTGGGPLPEWDSEVRRRVRTGVIPPEQFERHFRNLVADPREAMPEAASILLLAWPFKPYTLSLPHGMAGYSAYYRAYPAGRAAAQDLVAELERAGVRAVLQPRLPSKALALRAGLGSYGKNSLIYHQESGSFISLHVIVTDVPLEPDSAPVASPPSVTCDCGDCVECMRACPTGAIQAGGAVDVSRCVRAYMNSGQVVPIEVRKAYGTSILGCDACERCCPRNAVAMKNAVAPPDEDAEVFSLAGMLGDDPGARRERLARMAAAIGRNYSRENRILADAAVAAGNTKDPMLLVPLGRALQHPHEPVRAHAAWAIGEIGGRAAARLLEKALSVETSDVARSEAERALERALAGGN
ncbi:MAG: epoxyqueuosine reductase [Betaproteobacteria bacterium]